MQSWRIDNRELEYVSELLKSGFPGRQERSFTAELEKLLEKLRKIKEKNHPDKFAGLNVS